MKPPKSILDPRFRYLPSGKTDVGATFRRIRREQEAAKQQTQRVVRSIVPRKP